MPVARDVPQRLAVKVLEHSEDYPGVLAQQESVRAYPSPYGVNAAHLLGYLSPITEGELDEAEKDDDASVNGASVVGRAGVEKAYDACLRGTPGYKKVAVDSMGRVLGDSGEIESSPGDTLVTSIDAEVQAYVEKQLHAAIKTARETTDTVTGRKYDADSGSAVVLEAKTGRVVAMASQPTYDPEVWSGGITQKQLNRLYSEKASTPLLFRATQGQFAPGLDVEADDDRRRDGERLRPGDAARLLLELPGGQPRLQELRVRRLRLHRLRQGARGLLQHLLLPDRLRLLAEVRHRRRRREGQGPAGLDGQEVRLRQDRPASTSRARPPAGSRTGSGSATTGSR